MRWSACIVQYMAPLYLSLLDGYCRAWSYGLTISWRKCYSGPLTKAARSPRATSRSRWCSPPTPTSPSTSGEAAAHGVAPSKFAANGRGRTDVLEALEIRLARRWVRTRAPPPTMKRQYRRQRQQRRLGTIHATSNVANNAEQDSMRREPPSPRYFDRQVDADQHPAEDQRVHDPRGCRTAGRTDHGFLVSSKRNAAPINARSP